MIIPLHDNRFFSGMAQVFERLARQRHWYPIVVSTLRDPALELETVRTLISYRIEYLVVAGATDPDSVSDVCRSHGVAHVNVDLPGTKATSVISDNYWGAQQLTRSLIDRSRALRSAAATGVLRRRIGDGLRHAATHRGLLGRVGRRVSARSSRLRSMPADTRPISRRPPLRRCIARLKGLPRALFVNSTIALEGVVRFLKTLPPRSSSAAPSAATTGTRSPAC